MRVISGADVRALLPMAECIALMAGTLARVSAGEATIPLRTVMRLPSGRGAMGLMPGAVAQGFGIKLLSLFPDNPAVGLSSHLGLVLLFEPQHGRPVAMIDASEITAIRTAAVSGAATRLLARKDAGDLAILGSGEQAASHLAAMACVRRLRRVRVWSRTAAHAQAFADRFAEVAGVAIEPMESAAAAVAGADLICAVTAAKAPVLTSADVADGAHVNAAGASQPDVMEIDVDLFARARVIADFRPSLEAEAGEYRQGLAEGRFGSAHVAGELGELVAGTIAGRRTGEEVTLFRSLGIAAEDLAVADFLLERATAQGLGQVVEI